MLKVTKPARRKCAICQEWFIPRFQNERWCCPEHGAKLAIQLREREKAKAEQRLKKEKEAKRKESSARIRKRKEEIKPLSKLTQEAQAAFNKYIRIRDSGQPCISCQTPLKPNSNYITGSAIDASHYRSRGAASHLRFNVFNVHASCTRCNRELSGNAVEFRIHLINKIGFERVERIESENTPRRFDAEYMRRIKKIFTKKSKLYEKFRN